MTLLSMILLWTIANGAGADAEILLTKNGNLVQKGLHLDYTDTE